MADKKYVLGIDFGTLSARACVFDVTDGTELGSGTHEYAHGVMDDKLDAGDGQRLPPEFALQVPADYIESMTESVTAALQASDIDANDVIGIGIDFTSATMLACTQDGTPLCELDEFKNNPHAYVKLWKHHGASEQADRIVELAEKKGVEWLDRFGGAVSSELAIPKILETLEEAPEVYQATEVFCDAVDWIPWILTDVPHLAAGDTGYKKLYQDGKFPDPEFMRELNPDFENVVAEKLDLPLMPLGGKVGGLTAEYAEKLGLPEGIAVATGNIDAHVTAAAVQAVENGQLTAIMGTSACYLVSNEQAKIVDGMFGVVDGGIVDGAWGYESGQTAIGDIFAWFLRNCVPASYSQEAEKRGISIHEYLSELAAEQQIGEHGLIALDWHNGNRSVLMDPKLSGLMIGMTLATTPEDQYRALLEASCFGARTIIEAYENSGVDVTEVIVAGGLVKNKLLMQMLSDILHKPLSMADNQQPGAHGSAVFAAVAAGAYDDVRAASAAMGSKQENVYQPDEQRGKEYDVLFEEYTRLHDHFGRGGDDIMHRLRQLRHDARDKHTATLPGEGGDTVVE